MEFKRTNSSRTPLSRRGSTTGTTPTKRSTVRCPSARGSSEKAAASPRLAITPPLPPTSGRTISARRASQVGNGEAFERSNSNTENRGRAFRRSSTAVGMKKAEVMKANNRVNVYARVRAFLPEEVEGDAAELAVNMTDDTVQLTVPKKGAFTFGFDGCFWSNDRPCPGGKAMSRQADIFEEIGRPLVENALAGYNSAILAYGQTGSGKTFTAFGPAGALGTTNEGLIPRVCNMIFRRADASNQKGVRYVVRASMLEVYLEDVYDLLNHRKKLTVRNHYATNGFSVVGGRSVTVHNYNDIFSLLDKVEPLRTFAATNIHDHSSRAHTLFTLDIQAHFDSKDIAPRCAKIMLADLAGSERIRLAGTEEGLKFDQARNINLSLLSLGCCIEAVAMRGKTDNYSIPEFRTSTLTKLLKDYIGGNSVSTMIVTIAPSVRHANLSVQSLRFADRAKRVTSHAIVNTVDPDALRFETGNINDRLREEYLRKKEALYAEYQLMSTIEKLLARIVELEDKILQAGDNGEITKHLLVEIEELQKSLADADSQLSTQRQILYGQYLTLEDDLRNLNSHLQEMRAEHEDAVEALLGDEAGRFEDMRRTHEHRIDVLTRKLNDKEALCTESLNEIAQVKYLVAELEAKLRAKDEEGNSLLDKLAALHDTHESYKREVEYNTCLLTEQLEAANSLLVNTEREGAAQHEAMTITVESLTQDVARLEANLGAKTLQYDAATTEMQETIERITKEMQYLEEQTAQEAAELQRKLQETVVVLEDNQSQLAQMKQTHSAENSRLTDAINKSQETVAELRTSLLNATDLLGEKCAKVEALADDLKDSQETLLLTTARLEETERQLNVKVAEADTVTKELRKTEAQLQKATDDMEAVKVRLVDQTAECDNLGDELRRLQQSLEDSQKELKARDAFVFAVLQYVIGSYHVTLASFSHLQDFSMEIFMDETEAAFNALYDRASRDVARFNLLRQVLGKIDEDVKTANAEINQPLMNLSTADFLNQHPNDISNRENGLPRARESK